jgi:large subunit ribosomal protein L35Ae
MDATIVNYRRGRKTQTPNQLIIEIPKVEGKEKATTYVGKAVSWKSPAGKEIKGKIVAIHGGKGAVRAIMETGMPGQSIGSKISVE